MAEQLDIIVAAVDKASAQLAEITRELAKLAASGKEAQAPLESTGTSLSRIGEIASGILASDSIKKIGDKLLDAFTACIEGAKEEEVALAKMDAIIQATGSVAGVTTDEMVGLAESLALQTRFSKDANMAAESILLTFTNLGDDVLPRALRLSQDMSTVFGLDLSSSARYLARALEDPAAGFGALSRVIGKVPADEQAFIKSMADAGDMMGAQMEILDLLDKRFGGVAVTVGETTAGKFDIAGHAVAELGDRIGSLVVGPMGNLGTWIVETGIPQLDAFAAAFDRVKLAAGETPIPWSMPSLGSVGGGMPTSTMPGAPTNPARTWSVDNWAASPGTYDTPFGDPNARWAGMNTWGKGQADADKLYRDYVAQLRAIAGLSATGGASPSVRAALGGSVGGGETALGFNDYLAMAFPDMGAAQGWQGAFAAQHGGRAPGMTDLRDQQASLLFQQKYGKGPSEEDWKARYYSGSFAGIDEKGAGLDALFGKPGTWDTLISETEKANKKQTDDLAAAFAKVMKGPIPVSIVAAPPPGGNGGDSAHASTLLAQSRM